MPVAVHNFEHFLTAGAPGSPTAATSITKDAGARVSFRAPVNQGAGSITHYVVTPYTGGSPQSATTLAVADCGSITGSDGNTYRQADVTGLTNDTAYTFTVKARNAYGDSTESTATGANTPRSGLVFGDEFNGAANGFIDPEWWLLDVASTADEDDYYRPDHVYLDGSGNLVLLATNDAYGGKPFTSGCIQSNVRNFFPSGSNSITFETRAQVCPGLNDGMWPSPWLAGTGYQQSFKTDQNMDHGWDNNQYAEIDIAEWNMTGTNQFLANTWASSSPQTTNYNAGMNVSLAQHVYRCDYRPNTRCVYWFDGTTIGTHTSQKPVGAFFFMWFQQIQVDSSPSFPQRTYVDYVRIYDRDLG